MNEIKDIDCFVLHHLNDDWVAGVGGKWETFSDSGIDTMLDPHARGETPEEAINNLLEILNAKD